MKIKNLSLELLRRVDAYWRAANNLPAGQIYLVFVGLSRMHDPPRQEAKEAVAKCRAAGIRVVMIADLVDFVKAEAVANNLPEPNWLFPGRQGGLVTEADERWHRDLFKQVVNAAHLPAFVPYDLRHTFASLLLSCNVPLLYVSYQNSLAMPNRPRRLIIMRSGFPTRSNIL